MSDAALLPELVELLEAERAGARVALQSAREAGDGPMAELLRLIQRDEAHWCRMLAKWIRRLGGRPGRRIGAFHGKAMAIGPLPERIAFLNRGQAWVVRRLRELSPRVADPALRDDLAAMLRGHEENIARAGG